ncbi:Na+/H+ antiporter NhaC family protein [Haloferula chungangensis]|uniref:Na+/H+ antiporter NhaC family protein n=1 Tax=Haloferula chungangensis TaxID=1048331 RepID=A0ABW2L7R3_9BACT
MTELLPFWPVVVALATILLTRNAAAGLGAGVIAGCLVLAGGSPVEAVRIAIAEHLFPALDGTWHVSALIFTLLLGAFAGTLETSGGFTALLKTMLAGSRKPERRVLGSVYGLGLLCFFDGLANSMLMGRISRSAVDRIGVSREKLAWVVDSTSSPVACIAFISTWIAFQLTLIGDNLPGGEAYALYLQSIPANPYCLLTLFLVPLAIFRNWEPGAMKRFTRSTENSDDSTGATTAPWRVLVPLGGLGVSIMISLQIWSGEPIDLLSLEAWRVAASGSGTPFALVGGALGGLLVAWTCYPPDRRREFGPAMFQGAAGLLPAVLILILAWCLGSVFQESGAAQQIQLLLGDQITPHWLPLAVFAVTSLTAFATGSSWGTMALLMPLALNVLSNSEASEASETALSLAPGIIGAVFGGAVFGDHCSPFSDTTVVSALASGCRPIDHVVSQLPYALTAASAASLAYLLMAIGLPAGVSTLTAATALTVFVVIHGRRSSSR